MHVIRMLLGIDKQTMKLEVEEVVEAVADIFAPIKEEAIEDIWLHYSRQ